jgi:DNA-directed RNA polymerase specialized sigma24 family protein
MNAASPRRSAVGTAITVVFNRRGKRVGARPVSPSSRGVGQLTGSSVVPDSGLVMKMVAGDVSAFRALESGLLNCVWTVCREMTGGNDRVARDAFHAVWSVLTAESFHRCAVWSGVGSFETFLTLQVRDLLLQWIVRLLGEDSEAGWRVFSACFDREIRRRIVRFHANASDWDDARQNVLIALWQDGCRRLQGYSGRGSFTAHVRAVVDNLLIDDFRRVAGRRRLPAAIEALSPLDRQIFTAIYWDEVPAETGSLLAVVASNHPGTTRADIEAARNRVQAAVPRGYSGRVREVSLDAKTNETEKLQNTLVDQGQGSQPNNPLEILLSIHDEALLEAAIAALKRAMEKLDDEDRNYLHLVLDGVDKPRDLAKALSIPAENIYVVKARVQRRLRAILAEDSDVTAWKGEADETEGT